jgi:hypothetical protein
MEDKKTEFVIKLGEIEIRRFFVNLVSAKGDKRLIFGFPGMNEHITHFIDKENKISLHKTFELRGSKEYSFVKADATKLVNELVRDIENKMLGNEYFGKDLLLITKEEWYFLIAVFFYHSIKETKKKTIITFDMLKNLQLLQEVMSNIEPKPITREDLSKHEVECLINPAKEMLLYFKGTVYKVDNFNNAFHSGTSGKFFGYDLLDLNKIEDEVKKLLLK